jgi:IMP dehydrogenase
VVFLQEQKRLPESWNFIKEEALKPIEEWAPFGAMSERNDTNRYSQDGISNEKLVPEGVEGRVPFKGWVVNVIDQLIGGIRQSMGYVGCKTIEEMHKNTQFVEITNAGITESHVHDVMITKEAPNYQRS